SDLKIQEIILIAFSGTLIASVMAIPLGLLAAKNVSNRYIVFIFKWILSANRSFPEIILAVIFVAAVGPNAFAGVLAIAVHSTGMLGKLYSEVVESIEMDTVDTIKASGANRIQVLFQG